MRLALLGKHPDGVALAAAFVASGRHQLAAVYDALPSEARRTDASSPRKASDLEEILSDPAIEAIIVAGPASVRPAQIRRALQSEHHVLCVHPPDATLEIVYEAAMLRADTGRVLFPILPEVLHPAFHRFGEFGNDLHSQNIGTFRLLLCERTAVGQVLAGFETAGQKPTFPGWDVLRSLRGEIAEVSGFAEDEVLSAGQVVLLTGRFESVGVFQTALLPNCATESCRLTMFGDRGHAELFFPQGRVGPAFLNWRSPDGQLHEEAWEAWDPWPALVEQFEASLEKRTDAIRISWQDTIRMVELDDAARRSVAKRRSSLMEYQEASEEVGFKGTMTLVGCGMLLLSLTLLILTAWVPWAGYLIVPLLAIFLLLQTLRSLAADRPDK